MPGIARLLLPLLAAFANPVAASPADAIVGRWQPVEETAAIITVSGEGAMYQGRLTAHAEQPTRVGVHVLRDLRYIADENRWAGQVYAVRRDKLMEASLRLESADELQIEVETWFGTRRIFWRRVP